ncbi:hypothetical protein D3C72_2321040 [compost metagenome]
MKKILFVILLLTMFTGSILAADLSPKCQEDLEWIKYACGSGDPFACIGALIRQKIDGCSPD